MKIQASDFYQYQEQIILPENVTVSLNHQNRQENCFDSFLFSGPLGTSIFSFHSLSSLKNSRVAFSFDDSKNIRIIYINSTNKSCSKLYKSILENKCIGVSRGFLIYLKISGIGYRVVLTKNERTNNDVLIFKLGYSHDIRYEIPTGIRVFLQNPTSFCLFGLDKNQLTQIAAAIKNLRKPNAYKEKGIRLLNEKVTLKVRKKLK